jgi:hypothetical protein
MEYISAEEFLKQDIDIQIVFMEWWIPKVGDLFYTNEYGIEVYLDKKAKGMFGADGFYTSKKVIPLLTEGQLRKFIEDKDFKIAEISRGESNDKWYVKTLDKDFYTKYSEGCENLLQAYWKVALEIAKEEIKED